MAFNMPDYCSAAMKPVLENSLSTYSFQPKEVSDPNSKRMGTGSEVPWRISISGIEEAKGVTTASSHLAPSENGHGYCTTGK